MTVAPELPPVSAARRGEAGPGPAPAQRRRLRAVPTSRAGSRTAPRDDARTGPTRGLVQRGAVGTRTVLEQSVVERAVVDGAVVERTVLERRELRRGATVLVERTVLERPGGAPVALEEVVDRVELDRSVERHPAGRARTRPSARRSPVALVPAPPVPDTVPAALDWWDDEPGAGAGREHRPAAPVRLRPAGARVVRPAAPAGLRLSSRGRALLVAVWIAAAVVVLLVTAGRLQDLAGSPAVPASAPAEVTVAPGETLWSIAERVAPSADPRGVVAEIRRLNGIGTDPVRAGQTLLLRSP